MVMSNNLTTRLGEGMTGEIAAKELAVLMDEFIDVVLEENELLARGLPASLSSVSARKNELAQAFESWVRAAETREFHLETAPERVRKQFLVRLEMFQKAMNENILRLEAAMTASRLRIDAVMSAIRQEMVEISPYGANGKVRGVATRTATRPGSYI
jgi:hypothetical protein